MEESLRKKIERGVIAPHAVGDIFQLLQQCSITNFWEVETFLGLRTSISERLSQEMAERYIAFARNTTDAKAREQLDFFVEEIEPIAQEGDNALDAMLLKSNAAREYLNSKAPVFLAQIQRRVDLYRSTNLAIFAEEELLSQNYVELVAALTVEYNGKSYTMQEAGALLESTEREVRHQIYLRMLQQRLSITDKLHELMDGLLKLRYQIAVNVGFKNYRDYRHMELERFSYSIADVHILHQLVEKYFVPIADKVMARRKRLMAVNELKPWDLDVDIEGYIPLKPFERVEQLLENGHSALNVISPRLGNLLNSMAAAGNFDLESRTGKAPGAFSYPLPVSHSSFIFMNAAGTYDDVVTLMHEMGHAVHEQLSSKLPFFFQKDPPMEVAELPSMSMELISTQGWSYFYNPRDLRRAKTRLLEEIALTLPWIAAVDEFQHWLYTHPEHSHAERDGAWTKTYRKYACHEISWLGVEEGFVFAWQKQLHIFEDPFYYIEYAIAQLGALELYQQFISTPEESIDRFLTTLELGGSLTVEEIYSKAGLDFNFSSARVAQLSTFLDSQLNLLWD